MSILKKIKKRDTVDDSGSLVIQGQNFIVEQNNVHFKQLSFSSILKRRFMKKNKISTSKFVSVPKVCRLQYMLNNQ